MKIYTSYFAKQANNPKALAICRWTPKWYNGRQCLLLAPSDKLLRGYKNGEVSEEEYAHAYTDYLNSLTIEKVLSVLTDGDVLLCYERSSDFCHRHILAKWLTEHGVQVEEMRC